MDVLLCGVVKRSGKSKRTGEQYSFAQALVLVPLEPVARPDLSVQGAGYELRELDCDDASFRAGAQLSFPLRCELVMDTELRRSGPVSIVRGIKPLVAPVKAAG